MKNLLTRCKRLLAPLAAAVVLAGGPSLAGATTGALQEETGALLRRVEAQHQDIARLQQRLQSGPLGWPAWWGGVGAAGLIGLATLALRQRRGLVGKVSVADLDRTSPAGNAWRQPAATLAAAEPPAPCTPSDADAVAAADMPPPAVATPHVPPDLLARADALLTLAGEVEFLASIGLHHGAVDVLEQHLALTASPAPLAWLELVNLHRSEGDGAPATAAWHRLVARLPAAASADAEAILDDTDGLEAFPAVLARVQETWSTPLATEQLAAELMETEGPLLTLAAGRDLLWLLQVCHERASARPAPLPQAAGDTSDRTVVLTAADWVRHLEALEVTPRDQAAAVDIDVGVPGWIEEAKASVRVADMPPLPGGAATADRAQLDGWHSDLFDAATGFERRRPAARLESVSP